MSQVLHWLLTSEKHEKTARGRCPRTPAGAYAPRTLRTQVLKKGPPTQLVFAVRTSQKRYEFTPAF